MVTFKSSFFMSKSIHSEKIMVTVELGSPAAECAHFGICSVSILPPEQWDDFHPRHLRQVKALLWLGDEGVLCFEFPLEAMRPDTRAQFFPPEGFRVDSGRGFSEGIMALLGVPSGTRPIPGMYTLVPIEGALRLRLLVEASLVAVAA